MRNGIYRVWVDGPAGKAAGAVVLKDGRIFAVDRQFAFHGSYLDRSGRFSAAVTCQRLCPDTPPMLPDCEELHLRIEGGSGYEFAELEGTLDEVPGYVLSLQYAFLSEE